MQQLPLPLHPGCNGCWQHCQEWLLLCLPCAGTDGQWWLDWDRVSKPAPLGCCTLSCMQPLHAALQPRPAQPNAAASKLHPPSNPLLPALTRACPSQLFPQEYSAWKAAGLPVVATFQFTADVFPPSAWGSNVYSTAWQARRCRMAGREGMHSGIVAWQGHHTACTCLHPPPPPHPSPLQPLPPPLACLLQLGNKFASHFGPSGANMMRAVEFGNEPWDGYNATWYAEVRHRTRGGAEMSSSHASCSHRLVARPPLALCCSKDAHL